MKSNILNNPEVKQKMIEIKKTMMLFKIHLKANKNLNKKIFSQLKVMVRKIHCVVFDFDEKLNNIKQMFSGNGTENENEKNLEEEENNG